MPFARRILIPLLFALLAPLPAFTANVRKQPTRPAQSDYDSTACKGAIIMDAATGDILFEDRADIVSPPASMTKLMTFAVVHDHLKSGALRLDTPVKITPEDARMGGTQVFLDPRETFSVEELIYSIMIQSANDGAHALARAVAGSVAGFVELMNAKARDLGMTRTVFRTPHGLPPSNRKIADGDLTSPRDFARLSRYLIQNTTALYYASIPTRLFGEGLREEPMIMRNHNHLLGKVSGVDGLKTGFTNGAGFCLAATAQRNGRRVIVVTMGSPQAKVRDLHVTDLIERGFAALPISAAGNASATTSTPGTVATGESPIQPASPPPGRQSPASVETPVRGTPAKPERVEPVIKFSIPPR